eukprot:s2919_g1.t1
MAGAAPPARLSVQVKECGRTLDWSRLCSLLERRKDFVDVDVVSLSAAMNLLAKVVQWQRAIDLLHSSSSQEVRPNERSFHACLVAAQWSRALCLFNGMPGLTLQHNAFVQCAAVTSVAQDAAQWQRPTELLISWCHSSLPPALGSCNAALSLPLCRAWRRVLGTTQALMQHGSVQPDIISHNSMSELFAELGDWRRSVGMAQQQNDDVTVNIALGALCEASQWPSSLTHLDASAPVRRWTRLLRSVPWRGAMEMMDAMQLSQLRGNRISHGALLTAMAAGAAWQRCLRQVTQLAAGLSDVAFNAALASLRRGSLWARCLALVEHMHCLRWASDDVARTEVLTAAGKADAWWATLAMMEDPTAQPESMTIQARRSLLGASTTRELRTTEPRTMGTLPEVAAQLWSMARLAVPPQHAAALLDAAVARVTDGGASLRRCSTATVANLAWAYATLGTLGCHWS